MFQKKKSLKKTYIRSLDVYNPSPQLAGNKNNRFIKNIIRIFNRYKIHVLVGLVLVFLILFCVNVFRNSDYFEIKHVEVTGANEYVNLQDFKTVAAQASSSKNLVTYNVSELARLLSRSFLGVKEVKVTKKYPDSLVIKITERSPIAYMHTESSDELFLVDESGFVLGMTDKKTKEIPIVVYNGFLKTGITINKDLVPAYLEIYEAFKNEKVKFSSMSFYPDYARIYLDNGVQLYLGSDKKIKESVKVVQDLITQLNVSGKNPLRIDLRYDKVIVEY